MPTVLHLGVCTVPSTTSGSVYCTQYYIWECVLYLECTEQELLHCLQLKLFQQLYIKVPKNVAPSVLMQPQEMLNHLLLHGSKDEPQCLNPLLVSNPVVHQQCIQCLYATLHALLRDNGTVLSSKRLKLQHQP